MRFMVMHKVTDEMEKGLKPSKEVIDGVQELIGQAVKDRIFVSGEGLKPTSERVHIAYKGGTRTITDGPFRDAKELIAGFALMRVQSREEAISWCDRFAALLGDVELFMGPVVEAWDLGILPKPKNPPQRFLSMHQMTEAAENEGPPSPELMKNMGALEEEMKKAGVLQATGGLASTKRGARIRFDGERRTVMDGPFAESKELVAGYAIVDLPSKAAAVEWAIRYGEVIGVDEVDVRQMAEW